MPGFLTKFQCSIGPIGSFSSGSAEALLYLRKKPAGGAEPDWDLKKQSDLEEPSSTRKNEPEFLGQEGAGGGTL
jgi:hypothetical protein